jgi:ferrous iron transport protein A
MRSFQTPVESGSLLDMPSGCPLLVDDLQGSPSIRSRLYAIGILPGTEIEVCRQARGKGSVCVRVRQCSLVLGESMARAITCRPAECPCSGRAVLALRPDA